jgi:hypothetical protein
MRKRTKDRYPENDDPTEEVEPDDTRIAAEPAQENLPPEQDNQQERTNNEV